MAPVRAGAHRRSGSAGARAGEKGEGAGDDESQDVAGPDSSRPWSRRAGRRAWTRPRPRPVPPIATPPHLVRGPGPGGPALRRRAWKPRLLSPAFLHPRSPGTAPAIGSPKVWTSQPDKRNKMFTEVTRRFTPLVNRTLSTQETSSSPSGVFIRQRTRISGVEAPPPRNNHNNSITHR